MILTMHLVYNPYYYLEWTSTAAAAAALDSSSLPCLLIISKASYQLTGINYLGLTQDMLWHPHKARIKVWCGSQNGFLLLERMNTKHVMAFSTKSMHTLEASVGSFYLRTDRRKDFRVWLRNQTLVNLLGAGLRWCTCGGQRLKLSGADVSLPALWDLGLTLRLSGLHEGWVLSHGTSHKL